MHLRCVKFLRFPDVNKLRRRNFPSGYTGRERLFVPTNSREGAGVFQSRERREEEREREWAVVRGLSLSFARGRGRHSSSLSSSLFFFLSHHILLSSAILLANAMRFVMRPRADRVRQTSLRYHCIILLPPPQISRGYYPYCSIIVNSPWTLYEL